MALRRQQPTPPPPGTNRFDQWDDRDLFSGLETAMMEATAQMDAYRRSPPESKPAPLALMETRLETAMEVLAALRRRVANDKRFQ